MTTLKFRQLATFPGYGQQNPSMVQVYSEEENRWEIHIRLGNEMVGNLKEFMNFPCISRVGTSISPASSIWMSERLTCHLFLPNAQQLEAQLPNTQQLKAQLLKNQPSSH